VTAKTKHKGITRLISVPEMEREADDIHSFTTIRARRSKKNLGCCFLFPELKMKFDKKDFAQKDNLENQQIYFRRFHWKGLIN